MTKTKTKPEDLLADLTETAARLTETAARYEEVRAERDMAIAVLAKAGVSQRRIGEAAGLSHVGVAKIAARAA